jgi:hypothetical protein
VGRKEVKVTVWGWAGGKGKGSRGPGERLVQIKTPVLPIPEGVWSSPGLCLLICTTGVRRQREACAHKLREK